MNDISDEKKGFTQGVVYSVAQLIRLGDDGYAQILWDESGFDASDLRYCDGYDAKEIRDHLL